jgi:thymidylate synthase (FAD)
MKVTYINHMGNDNTVVDAARVSFKKGHSEFTDEQNHKLIKYLAKHEHYSPFGHCFASFHVKAPVFVRAQLVKHEYLRMNEVSRRYVDTTPEFYVPDVWRGRPVDKKQGSSDIKFRWEDINSWEDEHGTGQFNSISDYSVNLYEHLLSKGVAPEQARMVLPQSMYTEWYWSGSLDAFAKMANLRCKPDAQEETRMIADQVSSIMSEQFPISWGALTNES